MIIETKNYKDTVFRMLFSDKKHLLELYNAMNKSSYTNPDDLEITTLSGNTFLSMKNDISFIFHAELDLYEHQSTPCPNIPLRDLFYVASIYKKLVPIEKTYSDSLIKIPVPRFVVFYNGTAQMEDITTYMLSDMFEKGSSNGASPALELTVTVYNINEGHNPELMELSKTLKGYSIFVSKVRKYKQLLDSNLEVLNDYSENDNLDESDTSVSNIERAITVSIDECISEDILRDFFVSNRKEVIEVGVLGYSAEKHMQLIKDESYESGVQNTAELFSWLYKNDRSPEAELAASDPVLLSNLFTEFNEWKRANNNQ